MNRLFGTKNTAPKATLDSAISNVSFLLALLLPNRPRISR